MRNRALNLVFFAMLLPFALYAKNITPRIQYIQTVSFYSEGSDPLKPFSMVYSSDGIISSKDGSIYSIVSVESVDDTYELKDYIVNVRPEGVELSGELQITHRSDKLVIRKIPFHKLVHVGEHIELNDAGFVYASLIIGVPSETQ